MVGLFNSEDVWLEEGVDIKRLFVDYFVSLFLAGNCNQQELILEKVVRRVDDDMNRKLMAHKIRY